MQIVFSSVHGGFHCMQRNLTWELILQQNCLMLQLSWDPWLLTSDLKHFKVFLNFRKHVLTHFWKSVSKDSQMATENCCATWKKSLHSYIDHLQTKFRWLSWNLILLLMVWLALVGISALENPQQPDLPEMSLCPVRVGITLLWGSDRQTDRHPTNK